MKNLDSFAHRLHRKDNKEAIIFVSGLGLDIKSQREAFVRHFAIRNHLDYLSLDTTKRAMQEGHFTDLEDEAFELIHDNFSGRKLLFTGACFGANIALRLANRFKSSTAGVLIMSPAINYSEPSIAETIVRRIERKKNACQKLDLKEQLQQILIFQQLVEKMLPFIERQEQIYLGPIKILHPQKDNFIPVLNSENMLQALRRSNVQLHILPDETHTLKDKNSLKIPFLHLAELLQKSREL